MGDSVGSPKGSFAYRTFAAGRWGPFQDLEEEWDSSVCGAALTGHDRTIWAAYSGVNNNNAVFVSSKDGGWSAPSRVPEAFTRKAPSLAFGLDRLWMTLTKDDASMRTGWRSDDGSWQWKDGPAGTSQNGPVLHFDGTTLWAAHTDPDGQPRLSRRINTTSTSPGDWSAPTPIGGDTSPTVLDTPGLITYQGRMYAFYHA